MPILMSVAEHVDKLHAICMVCGDEASRTQGWSMESLPAMMIRS